MANNGLALCDNDGIYLFGELQLSPLPAEPGPAQRIPFTEK